MKIFLATFHSYRDLFFKVKPKYILESFYYAGEAFAKYIKQDYCEDYILDSGAFTFMESREHVDWLEYLDRYIEFINTHDIDNFIELDIERLVGMDKVEQLRDRLETKTGKKAIPVWHPERGIDYWKKMCREYDYVAIGGMAQSTTRKYRNKIKQHFPWFIRTAHENNAKIHGLGFTSVKDLKKFKFDSVDSTSWNGGKFGTIYFFKNNSILSESRKNQRTIYYKDANLQNLRAWTKFQNYADKNL